MWSLRGGKERRNLRDHKEQGDFLREGDKPSSGSLKQGVWGLHPQYELHIKIKIKSTHLMDFKKGLIKCIKDEAGGVVGSTPEGMGCHIL